MARLLLVFLAFSVVLASVNVATMVQTLFLLKDTDRNGRLTSSELQAYFAGCDVNKDDRLSEVEFYHCSVERNHNIHHYAKALFKAFDVTGNHVISVTDAGSDATIRAMDENDDGILNQQEFTDYVIQILKQHGHG